MKNKVLISLSFLLAPMLGSASRLYAITSDFDNNNITELLVKNKQQKSNDSTRSFIELRSIIDQYAKETLEKGNINSLAIAIYSQKEVYQQYYGKLDKNSGQKPDEQTLYEIASISKVFVGSLAAKAVLEQKISLQDDVRMYLKEDYSNLQFMGTPITIKDLLTHTLGLRDKSPKKFDKVFKK